MANHTPLRLLSLAVLTAVSACGLVLDLPSPTLDPAIGATGSPDGSGGGTDAPIGEEAGGNPDSTADAPPTCDLTLPQNCGACGVDCSGGKCEKGICLVTNGFAGGSLTAPEGITIYGDQIYATINAAQPGIGRCSVNGCPDMQPIFQLDGGTYHEPNGIRNDDAGTLFWTSYSGDPTSGLYRTFVDGSTAQLNTSGPELDFASNLAVSGSQVLWVNEADPGGGHVCAATGCGGAVTTVDNGVNAHTRYGRAVILAGTGSVWGLNGEIVYCPAVDCSTGARVLADGYSALSTDGRNVYFRTYQGDLAMSPLDGDATTRQIIVPGAQLNNGQGPHATMIVGTKLYWAIAGEAPSDGGITTNGMIQKCTLPACNDIETIADKQAAPVDLATDGKAIYWVNSGAFFHLGSPGSIYKAPL